MFGSWCLGSYFQKKKVFLGAAILSTGISLILHVHLSILCIQSRTTDFMNFNKSIDFLMLRIDALMFFITLIFQILGSNDCILAINANI